MAERGIIFSGPMVRAILAGTKTVTRRLIRNQDRFEFIGGSCDDRDDPQNWGQWCEIRGERREAYCGPGRKRIENGNGAGDYEPIRAYAEVGDVLWVRETWGAWPHMGGGVQPDSLRYRATDGLPPDPYGAWRWRSPIFMPRWASRITLRVESVRPERLQEITPVEVRAEGVQYRRDLDPCTDAASACVAWWEGWDRLNGKRAPWDSNPFVWRIEFRREP